MNEARYKPMSEAQYNLAIFRKVMEAQAGRPLQHTEILDSVERWMDSGKSGLLLMGSVGTGKSTIANALCRSWQELLTISRFSQCDIIAESIRQDSSYKYEIAYHKGLLVLDDLGTEAKIYNNEETLPFILYRRYERNLPTIITTNFNLKQIGERYGDRIADRLRTYARIVMDFESLRR